MITSSCLADSAKAILPPNSWIRNDGTQQEQKPNLYATKLASYSYSYTTPSSYLADSCIVPPQFQGTVSREGVRNRIFFPVGVMASVADANIN